MADEVGIIHMNGRIYDPRLGRFLQADPFVQDSDFTQSYNRYSYGFNNPLNGTDPSGYLFGLDDLLIGAFIGAFVGAVGREADIPLLAAVGNILSCATAGPSCAAGFAFGSTLTGGGSFGDALKNGLIAGASAFAFSEIGGTDFGKSDAFIRPLAHGIVGGITNVLTGGKFGHGFVSAGLTKAFNVNRLIGTDASLREARVVTAAIIGGTISDATGGKFVNGAITAAFGQAYNGEKQAARVEELKAAQQNIRQNINNGFTGVGGAAQIAAGVAACSTGVGCIAGVPLIVLGASNIGEAATGFAGPSGQGFNLTGAAIQRGFEFLEVQNSADLVVKKNAIVNLTADLAGLNAPSLAKNGFKLFRNIPTDYVRAIDNATKTGLIFQAGSTVNTTVNALDPKK